MSPPPLQSLVSIEGKIRRIYIYILLLKDQLDLQALADRWRNSYVFYTDIRVNPSE